MKRGMGLNLQGVISEEAAKELTFHVRHEGADCDEVERMACSQRALRGRQPYDGHIFHEEPEQAEIPSGHSVVPHARCAGIGLAQLVFAMHLHPIAAKPFSFVQRGIRTSDERDGIVLGLRQNDCTTQAYG